MVAIFTIIAVKEHSVLTSLYKRIGPAFCLYLILLPPISGMILFCRPCPAAQIVDRIVAIVNSDIIRLSDLNRAMAPYLSDLKSQAVSEADEKAKQYKLREKVLNDLIDEKLADQEIKEEGIRVSDDEIDEAIEQIKKMNYYTDEKLRQVLNAEGLDMKTYRSEIKRQLLRNRLVAMKVRSKIIITDEDIKKYYDSHPELYGGEIKYRLSNIFIPEGSDPAGEKNVRAKMELVLDQLKKGLPFAEAARKYSVADNSKDGGLLGSFSLSDLSADVQKAVKNLKPGEFSDIVKTRDGFQIFYLNEKIRTKKKKLKDVEDEIKQRLYEQAVNEKFKKWLKGMRENAHIKIIM